MSNKELFNTKKFPEWKGYNTTNDGINQIKELWFNNTTLMAKTIYELSLENKYFKDILLYIQTKMYFDESLGLCLDSSKEVFDVMITPYEILNNDGKELTLENYDELIEYITELTTKGILFKCKVCKYRSLIPDNFEHHKCKLD